MSNKVIFYIGVVSKHDPGAELYVRVSTPRSEFMLA